MRIRYRILSSRMDTSEFGNVAEDIRRSVRINDGHVHRHEGVVLGLALAAFETPREVHSFDSEGEVESVREMIADGEMAPDDLVDPGDGWREARDFEPLAEVCERVEKRARRKQRVVRLAIAGGLVAAAGGAFLALR